MIRVAIPVLIYVILTATDIEDGRLSAGEMIDNIVNAGLDIGYVICHADTKIDHHVILDEWEEDEEGCALDRSEDFDESDFDDDFSPNKAAKKARLM